jgi:S1-C subfamily serine protease
VRAADRLRKVNGIIIRTVDDAQKSIYGAKVGDRLRLGLERAGKPFEVTVVLAEAPGDDA